MMDYDNFEDGLPPAALVAFVLSAFETDDYGRTVIRHQPNIRYESIKRWAASGPGDRMPHISQVSYNDFLAASALLRAIHQYQDGDVVDSEEWFQTVMACIKLDTAEKAAELLYTRPHHLDEDGNVVQGITDAGRAMLRLFDLRAEDAEDDADLGNYIPLTLYGVLVDAELVADGIL
jgi:hypothetical protein